MPLFWKSKRGGLGGGRTGVLLWNLGIQGLEVCRFVSVVFVAFAELGRFGHGKGSQAVVQVSGFC